MLAKVLQGVCVCVNTLNPGLLTPCLPSVLPGFLQRLSTFGEEPSWETVEGQVQAEVRARVATTERPWTGGRGTWTGTASKHGLL